MTPRDVAAPDAVRSAVELAGVLAPCRAVEWRVVDRTTLLSLFATATSEDAPLPPWAVAYAIEWRGIVAGWTDRARWPETPPPDVMRLAPCADQWPALCALARLGVHPIDVTDRTILLAVEAST